MASPPGNGGTGALAETGIDAWLKAGNQWDVDGKWANTIMIFNGQGDLIESWKQWDKMLQRPHFVAISPYDAQKARLDP